MPLLKILKYINQVLFFIKFGFNNAISQRNFLKFDTWKNYEINFLQIEYFYNKNRFYISFMLAARVMILALFRSICLRLMLLTLFSLLKPKLLQTTT